MWEDVIAKMVLPRIKIKNKEKAVIFLAGLRLYEGGTIDRIPTGAGETMLEKLWVFLSNFVGTSVNNQISKIEVFYPGDSLDCDCGAIVVKANEDAKVAERLTRACTCWSASAKVSFVEHAAVRVLKAKIRDHRKLHSDGVLTQSGVDPVDRSVCFCSVCCFLNRRVWITSQQLSPRDSDDEDSGEMEENNRAVVLDKFDITPIATENQLTAMTTILITVLGVSLARQIVTLIEGIRGANLSTMYEMVTNGVRKLFLSKDTKTLLPVKLTGDEYKSIMSRAITQVFTKTSPENSLQEAMKWSNSYLQNTIGGAIWSDETATTEQEELEVVGLVNNKNGNNGSEELVQKSTVPTVQEDEDVTVDEESLDVLYSGVKAVLKAQEAMDFDTMDTVTVAEATLKSLKQYKNKITTVFVKLSPKETVRREENYEKLINEVTLRTKMLQVQIQFFHSKSKTSEVKKPEKKVEKSEKLPTESEIVRKLKIFEACCNSLDDSFTEIRNIVENKVENNKNEFNRISSRIWPKVVRDMATLEELCNDFREWLRMSDLEIITKELRKELQKRLRKEQSTKLEYFRLRSLITLLSEKFSHATKPYEKTELCAMLIKESIEPFYGEESAPGKEWQNLFEWLKKVEISICRAVNNKQLQLNQIMNLLSPNIQKIARARRPEFKNYQELKAWLVKYHVNETKIIQDLQNRIATVKVKNIEEYLIHIRRIIVTIQEYCDGNPKLEEKLLSEKNISHLVKFIFKQLSHVTNRNEFQYYLKHTWGEYVEQLTENGNTPTPSQVLLKVDEHLEKVLRFVRVSNFNEAMNEEPSLYSTKKEDAGRNNGRLDKGRGSFKSNYNRSQRGVGKSSFSNGKGGGAHSSFNKPKTSVPNNIILRENGRDKFSIPARIVTTKFSKNGSMQGRKLRNNKGVNIQVPNPGPKKARNKRFDPGTKSVSSFNAVRFSTRKTNVTKESKHVKHGYPKPYVNYKKRSVSNIACTACSSKCPNDLTKRKGPMSTTIYPKKKHFESSKTKEINLSRLKSRSGKETPTIRTHCVMAEPGVYFDEQANNINTNEGIEFKIDSKTKHPGRPDLPTISDKEYKGSKNSKFFNTIDGSKTCLDLKKDKIAKTLIKASKGTPLYFLQQLNLAGNIVLCFFDSGSMFNLIKTAIARILDLKMVSRRPMYIVGAGEQVHSTEDGKYEIVLGSGKHSEKYVLEVAGSRELTGYIQEANFQEYHEEVREESKKYAEYGLKVMKANEPLPMQVGGMKAGLVIGLPTPSLQPVIIMSLPSGLLVAKSRLKDIYGSKIVFGGMLDSNRSYLNSHQLDPQNIKAKNAEEFEVFQNICIEEYFNFRDSLKVDMVHLHQGEEYNPKHQNIIESETDAMIESFPIVIMRSEEKKGEQLRKQKTEQELISPSSRTLNLRPTHMEAEPIEQFQVHGKREKLVQSKKQKLRKQESQINRQKARKELKNNVLMENLKKVDTYHTKAEELVTMRFNLKAKEHPVQERVNFDSGARKISYFEEVRDGLELDELSSENTSVQVITHQECTIGKAGINALQTAAKPVSGVNVNASVNKVEEFKAILGCVSASGDLDAIFDKIIEGLIDSDQEQKSKIKRAIRERENESIGTKIDYCHSGCSSCKECSKFVKQTEYFLRKIFIKSSEDKVLLIRFWERMKNKCIVVEFRKSISTPYKLVLDSRTSELNNHFTKGLKILKNLQQLMLKSRAYEYIGSFDIFEKYNRLHSQLSHFQNQFILWIRGMNPEDEMVVWTMLRAINGAVSLENQAETAMSKRATELEQKYSQGSYTTTHKTHVNSSVPCGDNKEKCYKH